MNRLQDTMRSTIKHYFAEACVSYEEKPREQWLFDYPAQVSLCGTQIWWTTEVNIAFSRLEEGYENAIKDYQKKQISQLSTLISLLLGELTKQDRQKIMTICTIDVHSRDVVAKLIQSKIESASAFQWQSQLRHRWDEAKSDCYANICDAEFRYSHEYLGNTPRLVITPLTDRCYITLTQSLHLVMGGGPAGPAGTGKTETTKDLGRALGITVYVFNCSEQMDYKSCGNIYKGLAQTGAWGCFDEFNRISVEVLSVVAVQVKSVQDAIRDKKSMFNFMGEQIALVPTRGDPGRPEEEVLMRALRDFNIPKVVTDDVPVFMGLIGDLFPALDVPRKRDLDFERTVKQAAIDLHLQPEDNFILKVVQLEELLEVRHSVFIVGTAGTGKTQVWKTLFRTYQNIRRRPVYNDLNPKAVTNDELFGIINPATREWKDGLLSVLMREQANLASDCPKWILLDGDIDPMWIESLNTVMDDNKHLSSTEHRFAQIVARLAPRVVAASLAIHHKVSQIFLPTATKFHYIFNLRDLSNIFQGLLFSTNDCLVGPVDMVRLWMHETQRVYGDKLTDEKDLEAFAKIQGDIVKKNFEEVDEAAIGERPNIYCHFALGIGEPKYMPISDWTCLAKLLHEALVSYNDLVAAMNLVLFEDAMMHVCRINRILESPRGSALLVGVGGSGKQSLARLAAFISSLEVAQIQLRKGYGVLDLKAELSALYLKSGLKNVGLVFLMTDAQVASESFLVLINDMLASGEVPDLFPDDEVENIIAGVRLCAWVINIIKFYEVYCDVEPKRKALAQANAELAAAQEKLSIIKRKVASLEEQLATLTADFEKASAEKAHCQEEADSTSRTIGLANRLIGGLASENEIFRDSAARFMAFAHTSVNAASRVFLSNERRYNYTTPKSFLEQISLYSKLLRQKNDELKGKVERLENGLEKLKSTAEQVDDLKAKLAIQEVELKQKNEAADALIEIVRIETAKVSREKALADEEECKVGRIAEEVSKKQQDCEEDLTKAEPALLAAQEALNTLNKANLTELKSFGSPPGAVTNVTAAVMVLLAPNGKIPKDRSWKAAKIVMAKVDQFLDALINYDKENIHPEIIKAIQPYLKDSEFEPEFVRSKSAAAAAMFFLEVALYQKYLEAKADLTKQQNDFKILLKSLEDDLLSRLSSAGGNLLGDTALVENLETTKGTAAEVERKVSEAKLTSSRIDEAREFYRPAAARASLLYFILNDLNTINPIYQFSLKVSATTLPGDVLLVTAFISYVGCFTKQYRWDLLHKQWLPFAKTLEPPIPTTEGLDPLSLLTDDAQIATWNNEGLPSDRMSTENATILTNSDRWPLMIDPQLQGLKWIRTKYGEALRVIRLGQRGALEAVEVALSAGDTVLVENIGESVDPVLDPLLGRNLIKKGRAIKIGDKEVEYNPKFRLILHTKLANPHYKPEMQAQTTLINFTVTRDGLEDQLLAEVVKAERPDLEELK
ncbi:hypothetical protein J437_LFUL000858, partial [Ladona fulva]